ncbi:uncharacterized protein [Penaeus vannamei]|uniref:uncharacterized protein n=1 Tax=Penaeus vannamei TaxID=6689 RepID=UPI00387FB1A5
MCLAFIDYEKAFEYVEIPAVLGAIRQQGVEEVYCVRQGDTTSAKLFTARLEEIFKKPEWDGKVIKRGNEYLDNLKFVDNIVLLSKSGNEMQQLVNDLNRESLEVGLRMNKKKTKQES